MSKIHFSCDRSAIFASLSNELLAPLLCEMSSELRLTFAKQT